MRTLLQVYPWQIQDWHFGIVMEARYLILYHVSPQKLSSCDSDITVMWPECRLDDHIG